MVAATVTDDVMLYRPPTHPVLVQVPPFAFAMIDGEGDPNTAADYPVAIGALYALSYPVVISLRRSGRADLKVRPLEGLWWAEDMDAFAPETVDRDRWLWTMMIRQPEDVPHEVFAAALDRVAAKHGDAVAARVRVERFDEGRCAQLMHVGPYSAEGPTIRRLHEFVAAEHLRLRGRHHEIYLGDPRRCAPERLRTIVRQPVAG